MVLAGREIVAIVIGTHQIPLLEPLDIPTTHGSWIRNGGKISGL
jgi:hypothetical protein